MADRYAPLNDLPTVVTGPGEYVNRAGDRVTVHAVAAEGEEGTTAFRVKGATWRMYRGKYRAKGYTIWHVSGRGFPMREADTDIVRPFAING